jgi:MFS family permease
MREKLLGKNSLNSPEDEPNELKKDSCCQRFWKMKFGEAMSELKHAPRELWLIYVLKFFESYAYFMIDYTFTIYLSKVFELTDKQAALLYGSVGILTLFYGFIFSGYIIDRFGVKTALILGSTALFIGRLFGAFTTNFNVFLVVILTAGPLGFSLGIPVMQIGIRKIVPEKSRSVAFSIFYIMVISNSK